MFSDPKKNIEQFGLMPGAIVADIGAGSGFYTKALSAVVGEKGKVYSIDIQKDLLEKIKSDANHSGQKNIEVVWANVEKPNGTRLREGIIDGSVISNLFFQIKEKEVLVKELKRISKHNGKVLVIDWTSGVPGVGPLQNEVFSRDTAIKLFSENGFIFDRDISVGANHYGIILKRI